MPRFPLLLITVLAVALGGCGQMGPLYMPPPEPAGDAEQFAGPAGDWTPPPVARP